jgi:hypothetical protein
MKNIIKSITPLILLTSSLLAGPRPVLHWDFEKVNNGIITDKTGQGTEGVLEKVELVRGAKGKAASFMEKGSHIKVDFFMLEDYIGDDGFTVSFWGYVDSEIAYNKVIEHNGYYFSFNYSHKGLGMGIEAGKRVRVDSYETRRFLSINDMQTAFFKDEWAHFAIVSNNEDTLKLYINGELAVEKTASNSELSAFANRYGNTLHIGSNHGGTPTLGGMVDEFKIFDKQLSERDIIAEFKSVKIKK